MCILHRGRCVVFPLLACALACGLAASGLAQPAPKPNPAAASQAEAGPKTEQTIERIRHEDAGTRIDELRVGGETKSITVQPKGRAAAYDIAPSSNNRNPASMERSGEGQTSWKILQY